MCELKSRDLDSRILVMGHLLQAGFTVIIGQQWAIYGNVQAENAPVGACLFTTANANQAPVMARWRSAGHMVIASDQEGLPFAGEGFLANIDPPALAQCHVFLAQSDSHREILAARFPDAADRVVTAGSPRIDLLRGVRHPAPFPRPYLLFNTSFGLVNSIWGDVPTACQRLLSGAGITQDEIRERVRIEQSALAETTALLKACLARDDIDVVLRPHPSEDAKMWEALKTARLTVVTGSDPAPWMQHAAVVIHSESTTGIEGAILGARCLNLSPTPSWSRQFTMHKVNETVATAAAAGVKIDAYLRTGQWPHHDREAADLFPLHGARNTAQHLARVLEGAAPLTRMRWQRVQRTAEQRSKFSVTGAEFQQRAQAVFTNAGLDLAGKIGMAELDDSVFLAAPADRAPTLEPVT
jgi:surface carbohydrate biosynthesis protein